MNDTEQRERQIADERFLRSNDQFNNLPPRFQQLILKSPHASTDFKDFFAKGGQVIADEKEPLALFRSEPYLEIHVNSAQYRFVKTQEGTYAADALFSVVAHEVGHDKDHKDIFSETGTEDEYVQFRSQREAKAIFNAFPIFSDLRTNDPAFQPSWGSLGYDSTGVNWATKYSDWSEGRMDRAAVIGEIARVIPAFPYTRDDMSGDKYKTWEDVFRDDFHRIKRDRPALPSEANIGPLDPNHRDHAMYQQVRAHVHRLDAECGRTPDDVSDRLTASLMCLAKANGLRRVDHVVLSEHKENDRVIKRENVFVVQGRLDDPAHCRGCMKTVDAVNSPERESYRQLDALNHQLDQQQALQQQRDMQQAHDPHQHVMRR